MRRISISHNQSNGFVALILVSIILLPTISSIVLEELEDKSTLDDQILEEEWTDLTISQQLALSNLSKKMLTSDQSPVWQWVAQAEISNYNYQVGMGIHSTSEDISLDSDGNAYVTGYFKDTSSFGSTTLTSGGGSDIFIAKLSSSGDWQWAVNCGGIGDDYGRGITVDSSGNSYVTGSFEETASFGSTSLSSVGQSDVFVVKLSSDGDWQYAVDAGGPEVDYGVGIDLDSNGNSYITGMIEGDVTFGEIETSVSWQLFVTKLSSTFQWQWVSHSHGNYGSARVQGISVDSNENTYITGFHQGDVHFGSTLLPMNGDNPNPELFVAKLSPSGSWLWAVQGGGSDFGYNGESIAVDLSGDVYVTGNFFDTATFGPTTLYGSQTDVFVVKLTSSGSWLWAVKGGGHSSGEYAKGIAVDTYGNAYVTGWYEDGAIFGSTSLDSPSGDIFVAQINPNGVWQWAIDGGGSSPIIGAQIAIGSIGNIFVTGHFYDTSSFGSTSLESNGDSDVFVAMIDNEIDSETGENHPISINGIEQVTTADWQLKDEEWSDLLCDMGLMCFMKHVIAAPDNERLTYIDTTVSLAVMGGARKPVNAIISDQYGSVVSEEPMECFESGSDATCSVHLQIESNIKRDLAFNSAADMFYGESDSIFNQAISGAATDFLITALLFAVCVAFSPVSLGASCIFLALWAKVKSITMIISLASYANVISDSLGSYENEAFPNRYISAIEVDGTTVDISDIRLHRLNDVDDSTISSLGSKDTLEFLAFSPVDLVLLDDGVELTDHEDMIQLTGDWPIEAVMIQGTGDYTVEVEGTGSGAYSLIGLRNDADTTATESDPAAASVAFLAEREQPISYGQTVSYSTIDRWDWDDEETVDWGYTEDDWFDDSYSDPEGELLMILIPIFLVVALGFVFVRRRGLTHSVLLGKSPTTPRPPGLGRVQRPPGLPGIGPSHIPRHSEQGSISRPPGLPRLDSLKSSMPIRPPELHLAQPREGVPRPKDLIDEIDNPMDSSTQPETSSEQLAPEGYGSKANHPEVPRPDDWD